MARQENFSRTCWIIFHCRGMSTIVAVTSADFAQLAVTTA
jgi:hypothetical protein